MRKDDWYDGSQAVFTEFGEFSGGIGVGGADGEVVG